MPLDRPLPDEPREALKMLWSVAEDQQIDINRHRDSIHKIWHVAPGKPRDGMLVYADGVDWNPGSGAGYYVYYAGAWHPMGGSGPAGPAGPPGATGPPGSTGPPGASTTIQEEGVPLTNRTTLNFIGTSVTAVDDAANSRTNVTITSIGQTPWLSDINGAGFRLYNTGRVGIGTSSTGTAMLAVEASTDRVLLVRGDPTSFGLPAGLLGPILQGMNSAQAATQPITLFASAINLMGGNVGIGIVSPVVTLQVKEGAGQNIAFAPVSGMTAIQATNDTVTTFVPMRLEASLFVLNGGDVGIGTASPSAKLYIQGPGNINPSVTFGSAAAFILNTGGAELAMGLSNSAPYEFWMQGRTSSNSSHHFALNPLGGNVGIGTGYPLAPLTVKSDDSSAIATQLHLHNPGGGSNGAGISFQCAYELATSYAPKAGIVFERAASNGGGPLKFFLRTTADASGFVAADERMRISDTGNVGIGKTNPGSKLAVAGLPTSSAGLTAGDIWIDAAAGRVLKIV